MKSLNPIMHVWLSLGAIAFLGVTFSPNIAPDMAQAQTPQANQPGVEVPPNRPGPAVATISPVNGKVTIQLINQTGTSIAYQVAGGQVDTVLEGRSEVTLQSLTTPINVVFYRPDHGFLIVHPQTTSIPGVLKVTFTESANPDIGSSAMTIEVTGEVYLN